MTVLFKFGSTRKKKDPDLSPPLWCILPTSVEDIEQGKRLAPIPTFPPRFKSKTKCRKSNGKTGLRKCIRIPNLEEKDMSTTRYQIHEVPGKLRITGKDRDLIECVSERLMTSWEPPQDRPVSKWLGLRKWVLGRTASALNRRIHLLWRAQLNHVDQSALGVQR